MPAKSRPYPLSTFTMAVSLVGMLLLPCSAHASGWHVFGGVQQGTVGGWVRVREFDIPGTRLYLRDDLHVSTMQTLTLGAWKSLSDDSQVHVGFATHRFSGRARFPMPVYFNGTTVPAGGNLDTATSWQDDMDLDAAWWQRLLDVGDGGTLWGSAGLHYTLLNFRMHGSIAANSRGHELKEDFYVQELPIPTFGLHLRLPLGGRLGLLADISAGRLPYVNSLRTEGGEVRLAQTNVESRLGVSDAFAPRWALDVYAFHRALVQSERSGEDGNFIRLRDTGLGLRLAHGW